MKNRPSGASSIEVLVAFTLLSSVLALATPLVVKQQRLLAAQRDYRLALDELTNQLDRLTALPQNELVNAVEQLRPSPFIEASLSGASLRGKLETVEQASRVTLQLTWDEPQREAAPVTLAAWVHSRPAEPAGQPARSESR